MAGIFKKFANNDKTTTRTLLHEAIPITGTIVSGTYKDDNIKDYSHGMFQSVYDYPYLSSSANHILDIAMGYSANSSLSGAANTVDQKKKINIYNEMAQVLVGYDNSNNIRRFDRDGDFDSTTTDKMDDAFFINFSRLLTKDEIKKGTFELRMGIGSASLSSGSGTTKAVKDAMRRVITIKDLSGSTGFKTNSPAGEYGMLYARGYASDGLVPLDNDHALISSGTFGGDGPQDLSLIHI